VVRHGIEPETILNSEHSRALASIRGKKDRVQAASLTPQGLAARNPPASARPATTRPATPGPNIPTIVRVRPRWTAPSRPFRESALR